jgi:hypothetical protein
MDFKAAMKFLKAFSACRPRIYKQFAGFPDVYSYDSQGGYVVFVDANLAKNSCLGELEKFAETNNLSIKPYRKSLMVTGPKLV